MFKVSGPVSFIAVGLLLALFVYSLYLNFKSYSEEFFPVTAVFQSELMVPNFVIGTDPKVQYIRQIHEQFRGIYYVEVKNATTGENVCTKNGSAMYTPSDITNPTVDLSWYFNDKTPQSCIYNLTPGQYFIETNYVIQREGKNDKFYETVSNVFEVQSN